MTNWKETMLGEIPNDWQLTTAEDFCVRVADGTHETPKPKENGKFLITSKHIKNGTVDSSSAYKISEEDFENINKRSRVDKWDVLFSMIGTVGEISLIDHEPDFAIKNVGLFKCGDEVKAKWLYYFLISKLGRDEIQRRLSGTTQQYITLGELRRFPIIIPQKEYEQKFITTILSSFDDKIELLRRQNKTLEKIAQTIFKEWFVKFKVNGQKLKVNNVNGLPEGWRLGKVKNFGEIICGKTPPKATTEYFGGNIPFIKIPDMHNQLFIVKTEDSLTEEGANFQKNKFIPKNSLCVSCIATVGLVSITSQDSQTNQQINTIIPNDEAYLEYLYFMLKNMKSDLEAIGSGGSATLNINTGVFSDIEILRPTDKALKSFHLIVGPLFEKVLSNFLQAKILSRSRNTLLPKLMKGEIRVKS